MLRKLKQHDNDTKKIKKSVQALCRYKNTNTCTNCKYINLKHNLQVPIREIDA